MDLQPFMEKVHLEVTEDLKRRGKKANGESCPIFLAIKEQHPGTVYILGLHVSRISTGFAGIIMDRRQSYKHSNLVQQWVEDYDKGWNPPPCKLVMDPEKMTITMLGEEDSP